MYGDLETMEIYWKELEYERADADKKACNGPCFIYAAHLAAGTGGAATAVIRDGHGTEAQAVIDLAALTSSNDRIKFDPPLYLKKGLYIDVGDHVTSVLVHFKPAKPRTE